RISQRLMGTAIIVAPANARSTNPLAMQPTSRIGRDLRSSVYRTLMTKYAAHHTAVNGSVKTTPIIPAAARIPARPSANGTGTVPAASGRPALVGLARSAAASTQSLKMYTALAIAEK